MKDLSIMVDDVKFNYRVGLIIKREDEVLVEVNPDYDFVVFPGGRVKALENSVDALKRELGEEMQIDISNDKVAMKGVVENFFNLDDKTYHELYFLYKINVNKDDKRFSDDMINHDSVHSYYKWVKYDKLNEVNLLPVVLRNLSDDDSFQHLIVNDLK